MFFEVAIADDTGDADGMVDGVLDDEAEAVWLCLL